MGVANRRTPALVAVLGVLSRDKPVYGYQVIQETGHPGGTVYPLLARLEEQGWITSTWAGPQGRGARCKVYRITEAGRAAAR